MTRNLIGLGFIEDSGFESYSLILSQIFDVFSIDNFDCLFCFGFDLLAFHFCLHLNLSLEQVDFFNVKVVLISHQGLDVISFQSKQVLVLVVVDSQHSVLMLFHLLLKEHIESRGLHQRKSQVDWQNHIHDVDLLDHNAI